MSLLNQPIDIQVEILRKLPVESLLQICRSSRHFQNLCHTSNQLDDHFKELTKHKFGIVDKLSNSWYLTFLTLYNDLMKTTDRVINVYPIDEAFKEYVKINTDLLRNHISILISTLFKNVIKMMEYIMMMIMISFQSMHYFLNMGMN